MKARPEQLGVRLAALRQKNGWTLDKVSRMTGVSSSTLSKMENQRNGASFDTLLKLSHGLGLNLQELLNPEAPTAVAGRRAVTRAGAGIKFSTAQYGYEVHASDLSQKEMIPLIMTVRARTVDEFEGFSTHHGEEFVYVLRGTVELHTTIYSPLRLKKGDSTYFDSSTPHAFIAVGQGDAELLSLCLGSDGDLARVRSNAIEETPETKIPDAQRRLHPRASGG